MVTIEIEGMGELEVDDSFLSLSPEEQDRTIQEITAEIQGSTPKQGMVIDYKGYQLEVPESFEQLTHEEQIAQLESVIGQDNGSVSPNEGKDNSLWTAAKRSIDVGQEMLFEGGASVARRFGDKDLAEYMDKGAVRNRQEADAYNYQRPSDVPPSIYDALKEGNFSGAAEATGRGMAESSFTGGVPMGMTLAGGAMRLIPHPLTQIAGTALMAGGGAMAGTQVLGEMQQEKRDRGLDVSQGASNTDLTIAGGMGLAEALTGKFGSTVAKRFIKEGVQEGAEEMSPLLSAQLQGATVEGEDYLRSGIEGAVTGIGTRSIAEPAVHAAGGVGNALAGRTTGLSESVDTDPNKAMANLKAIQEAKASVSSEVDADLYIGDRNLMTQGVDSLDNLVTSLNPFNPKNKGEQGKLGRVERYRNALTNLSHNFQTWLSEKENEGIKQNLFTSTGKLKVQDALNSADSLDKLKESGVYKALSIMDSNQDTNYTQTLESLFDEKQALGTAADVAGRAKSAQGNMGHHGHRDIKALMAGGGGVAALMTGYGAPIAGVMAGAAALKGRQKIGESLANRELSLALDKYHTKIVNSVNGGQVIDNHPFATVLQGQDGTQAVLKALPKAGHLGIEIQDSHGRKLSSDNTKAVLSKLGNSLQRHIEALSARTGVNPEIAIGGIDIPLNKDDRAYESKTQRQARESQEKAEKNAEKLLVQSKAKAQSLIHKGNNYLKHLDVAPQGFDADLLKQTIQAIQEAANDPDTDAGTLNSLTNDLKIQLEDYSQKGTLEGRQESKSNKEHSERESARKAEEKVRLTRTKAIGTRKEAQEVMENLKRIPAAQQEKKTLGKALAEFFKVENNPRATEGEIKIAQEKLKQSMKEAQGAVRKRMPDSKKEEFDQGKVQSMVSRIKKNPNITAEEIVDRISFTHGEATDSNAAPNRYLQGLSSKYALAVAYKGDVKPDSVVARALGKKHPEELRDALNGVFIDSVFDPSTKPDMNPPGLSPEQKQAYRKALPMLRDIAKEVHNRRNPSPIIIN